MVPRRLLSLLWGAVAITTFSPVMALEGLVPTSGESTESQDAGDAPAGQTVQARCLTCHGIDIIREQRLSQAGWVREVEKMIAWGASITDAEKRAILDELDGQADPLADSAKDAAALLARQCLVCHDARLIEQQRLTAAGWTREIDKMIGWGASPTASEREILSEYLATAFRAER